ncbi:DsbA family protein [Aeromicrobium sp. UC242_57]|uniref:DsbA family protein n=1 Tax=Aeromicrobium sp. UC242_57 TaxID=3374624 RepID=UPI00379E7AC1
MEFLDFECESCLAAYSFVEDLRERYDGQLTFAIRYFPLDGHKNSRNAAHAVEAAARQGKVEQMYSRMYETQSQWGEQQESQAKLFRTYAQDLGLDLDQYDTDVASASVADRVERDFQDGLDLGVTGTPTFFLNGKRLRAETTQQFYDAIDAAVS